MRKSILPRWIYLVLTWVALWITTSFACTGSARAQESDSLKFISWNIENFHHVPGYSFRGEIGTWRTKADVEAIRHMIGEAYDGVFLQEATSELSVRELLGGNYRILSTKEYIEQADGGMPLTRIAHPFSAISNDIKILSVASHSLPSKESVGRLTRDIQAIKLLAFNYKISILHLHAKSGCAATINSSTTECLLLFSQFEMLTDLVRNMSNDSDVVLVIGDLNRELLNSKILAWRKDKVAWIEYALPPEPCSLRAAKEPIDFVLVAKGHSKIMISHSTLDWGEINALESHIRISDHCPIAFNLKFTPVDSKGQQ